MFWTKWWVTTTINWKSRNNSHKNQVSNQMWSPLSRSLRNSLNALELLEILSSSLIMDQISRAALSKFFFENLPFLSEILKARTFKIMMIMQWAMKRLHLRESRNSRKSQSWESHQVSKTAKDCLKSTIHPRL